MMRLTNDQSAWLESKWKRVRDAQTAADKASGQWREMNNAMMDWCNNMGYTDSAQVAKIKGENLALKDALNTWDWFAREANRHMQDIIAFKAFMEMRSW